METKIGRWYQYSGAIHMHTTESDGTKVFRDVVEIGRQVGLDFMMFTDHMNLNNRTAGYEGIYGRTLAVVGYEHNDLDDNNHYLVFGSPYVYDENLPAQEYVKAANTDGALGIIAHPIEKRSREGKYPPYPWTAWDTELYDGLELWNQMSEWMERLTPANKLLMAFSPRKSMIGPPPELLKKWDELNQKRRYVGVAGVDAHAFPVSIGPFRVEIFPYKVHFRAIRTHIILDKPMSKQFDRARDQLYEAFRSCRVFVSNIRWGEADRFQFLAETKDNQYTCGDFVEPGQQVTFIIRTPSDGEIRLICNGEQVAGAHGSALEYETSTIGLYRVEVHKGKRGWIFSNHIRLGVKG